jgi:hypothetical protein
MKFETLQVNLLCDESADDERETLPKVALEALSYELARTQYAVMAVDTRDEVVEGGMVGHRIYMCDLATQQWELSRKIIPTSVIGHYQFPLTSMLTCMNDGRVMLCSNRDEDHGIAPRVVIFDPQSSDSSDAAFEVLIDPKKTAHRDQGSLVTLKDGNVMRIGGESIRGSKSNCALFNPKTKKWAVVGDKEMARASFCVVLQTGEVLITGGSDGRRIFNGCVLYNAQTNTFRATEGMIHARKDHAGCLMSNGNVFICGGTSYTNGDDWCEEYDVATGTWKRRAKLPRASIMHHCALLPDEKILISIPRGYSTIFNPATDSFEVALVQKPSGYTTTFVPATNSLETISRNILLDVPVRFVDLY